MGRLVVEEDRLAALPQRHVHVATTARPVLGPFGHEGREPAAPLGQYLGEELEQRRLVGGGQRIVDAQRRLEHPRPGLGVETLDSHVHGLAQGEQVLVPVRQHRIAQHGVAEESGRDRLQALVALLTNGFGRLGEDEEFVLEADLDLEAQLGRTREDAAQRAARADFLRLADELAEEHQVARLGRDLAAGIWQDADVGVGVAAVPAGVGDVVVELVVHVPAQHHVAEAEAAFQRRVEFVDVDVLAAQDAVDVVHPHLDVGQAAFLDDPAGIGRRLDLARFHRFSPQRMKGD